MSSGQHPDPSVDASPEAMGRRLAEVRARHTLTQAEMAQKLGLSTKGYQNYERGTREPPAKLLVQLHALFGVAPLWLLTGQHISASHLSMVEDVACLLDKALDERGLTLTAERRGQILKFLVDYFATTGRVDQSALDALLPVTE